MGIRIAPRYIDRVQLAFKRSAFRSQQALAEELGVVRSTVANFLKGKPVSRLNFIEISTILRLDWQEIADLPLQLDEQMSHLEELNYRFGSMGASASGENKPDRNCLRSLPYQNLPPQTNEFIGRSEEVSALMKYLASDHAASIITLDGIGGVGKTALVVEAAYRCLEARSDRQNVSGIPTFEAIIFTSAKESHLLPTGIVPRLATERTLRDIYRAIALTLDDLTITQATPEVQFERVKQSLRKQRTLLIVDNLETIEDRDKVQSFLYDLPPTVKSVITTREQTGFVPIRLNLLSKADSLRLIQQQAKEKTLVLNNQAQERIYLATGGIPLVILYAIGRLSCSNSLETVLEDLASPESDVSRFLFEKSVQELKKESAHKLLKSLAIFRDAPVRDAVAIVAGLKTEPSSKVTRSLDRLQQLSLVRQQEGLYGMRYGMLSLTREYAASELTACQDFEKEARERWVKWYLDFAEKYGGDDWDEWHTKYDRIEEEWGNFLEVLEWCAEQERYEDIRDLWQRVSRYAYIYGHWEDLIFWQRTLIEAAQRRGDWSTFVESKSNKGRILTLTGQLKEAEEDLFQAWEMREHSEAGVLAYLANNIAVLHTRKKQYEKARFWLDIEEALVGDSHLEGRERTRHLINILYYRAETYYLQEDYEQAKIFYSQIVSQPKEIRWQRRTNYARNFMAEIAIKQGNLAEAEKLLNIGLPVAERNKDKRRIACYQASFARLEKARVNAEKISEWAISAMDGFNRLGMTLEAAEMRSLLEESAVLQSL